jgi:hypothetical protein
MTNQGNGYSHLPEGTREHTYLVYHSETGAIVHGFKAIVLPYGDPSEPDLEREAIEAAIEATGHDVSALQTLAVQHEDLEHGVRYRVDVETRQVVCHVEDREGPSR